MVNVLSPIWRWTPHLGRPFLRPSAIRGTTVDGLGVPGDSDLRLGSRQPRLSFAQHLPRRLQIDFLERHLLPRAQVGDAVKISCADDRDFGIAADRRSIRADDDELAAWRE